MPQYDNTNSGLLAKNKRKEKDTHPDYSGSINVGGVEYWLSGWLKTGKEGSKLAGEKFFSLSVRPKDEQRAPAPAPAPSPPPRDEFNDDIPF
jgi:hypothetical protein